jgi:hypothetical protein
MSAVTGIEEVKSFFVVEKTELKSYKTTTIQRFSFLLVCYTDPENIWTKVPSESITV